MTLNSSKRHRGFTLLEMMITVAIIGILAAIAIPGYQRYVEDARESDAKGVLMALANAMERHHTQNYTYVGAADGAGAPAIFPTEAPLEGNEKFYDLTIDELTVDTYRLNATPKGAQAGAPTLRLRSTGERINWD